MKQHNRIKIKCPTCVISMSMPFFLEKHQYGAHIIADCICKQCNLVGCLEMVVNHLEQSNCMSTRIPSQGVGIESYIDGIVVPAQHKEKLEKYLSWSMLSNAAIAKKRREYQRSLKKDMGFDAIVFRVNGQKRRDERILYGVEIRHEIGFYKG